MSIVRAYNILEEPAINGQNAGVIADMAAKLHSSCSQPVIDSMSKCVQQKWEERGGEGRGGG